MITSRKRTRSSSSVSTFKLAREDRKSFALIVTNFPSSWNLENFEAFLESEGLVFENVEFLQDCSQIWFHFTLEDDADEFMKKLESVTVEDQKLSIRKTAKIKGGRHEEVADETWRTLNPYSWYNRDRWHLETDGLFGLKPQFLRSLGIIPPISTCVHVTNFDSDKYTLKELMDMAGRVELLYIPPGIKPCAKVKYTHPLEAVQAVSMFNNQEFNGQTLSVIMQSEVPNTYFLPKGLTNIGPGLGLGNRPLKDVASQYKRLQNNEVFNIKPNIFDFDVDTDLYGQLDYRQAFDLLRKIGVDPRDLLDALKWAKTKKPYVGFNTININDLPSYESQTSSNRSIRSHEGQTSMSPISNISVDLSNSEVKSEKDVKESNGTENSDNEISRDPLNDKNGEQSIEGTEGNVKKEDLPSASETTEDTKNDVESDIPMAAIKPEGEIDPLGLRFSNLPSSANFCTLYEKLCKIGQIVALNFTKPGCAEVRFSDPKDANTCLQELNNSVIDGNTIEVHHAYTSDDSRK